MLSLEELQETLLNIVDELYNLTYRCNSVPKIPTSRFIRSGHSGCRLAYRLSRNEEAVETEYANRDHWIAVPILSHLVSHVQSWGNVAEPTGRSGANST